MNKKIKQINISCGEDIIFVPYRCIKKLEYDSILQDKKNYIITQLDCIIENDGSILNKQNINQLPIQRINSYNDITYFDFVYDNNFIKENRIKWYGDDIFYDLPTFNKNQTSKLLRYNKIHIRIKPFVRKYTIKEIFELPIGTILQGEDKNKYTVYSFENNNKRSDIPMDMEHINMNYTIDKLGEIM